jgi:hypothetical protein
MKKDIHSGGHSGGKASKARKKAHPDSKSLGLSG